MATIALAVVASQIGGSAAFAAFATSALAIAGGIIDSAFVFPAIFGTPEAGSVEGARLSSLSPQQASEGAPINYCIGARVRVGGNVIWMKNLEEVKVTTSSGGGGKGTSGGGGGSSTTYEYYASAMIAVCEGEIDGLVKCYADGKVFLKEASPGTLDLTTTLVSTSARRLNVNTDRNYGPASLHAFGTSDTPFTDAGFITGVDATLTGFTVDTDNNTTQEVKALLINGRGEEAMIFKDWPAGGSDDSTDASITVTQEVPRHPSIIDRLVIYPGASNDAIDPLIEGNTGEGGGGVDNTPRFKNIAKMMLERLGLADYGNRLPQFNFVVNKSSTTTVREAIADILERGGLTASDYDVTGIDASYTITGYAISGAKSVAATLEPIMLVWNLGVQEENGVLMFYDRGNETTLTDIRDDDWSAHIEGGEPEEGLLISERPIFDLPSEVSVSYVDQDTDDQIGEARARRIDFVSDIQESINVPIVMTAGRARTVAEIRLWRAWNDKRKAVFKLPPRFLQATEGDIVPVTLNGETYNVRLTRISRGNNFIHDCEGVVQDNTEFDFTEDGEVGETDDGTVDQPGNLLLMLWNSGPLSDEHTTEAGFYWAFCLMSPVATFAGGSLYNSPEAAGTYSLVGGSPEATIFLTEDQLPDTANPNLIDNINTIDVQMVNGTLSSVNEIDLLNGANRVMMQNGELIGFLTATSIGTNRYTLSGLLRGLRNTERFTATHNLDSEACVLLESGLIQFESHNLGLIGATEYFKPVAVGQVVDDIDEEAFVYAGCTIKPFSVANVEATRDGSNDVTVTWDRRSRALYRELTAATPPPLVDGVETYEVDLLNPAGSEVIQTFSVTSPTTPITDAEVVAAGYSSGAAINLEVYQTSPTVGRGIVKEATV